MISLITTDRRRLDSTDTDDSDQEIPDREPEHDHATR